MIGGGLARPAEQFPNVFGNSEFLKKYPYFLPCAVPATFTAIAWIVTFLFLKETVRSPMSLSQLFGLRKSKANLKLQNVVASQEATSTTEPATSNDLMKTATIPDEEKPVPLRQLFVPKVLIAAGNYACLSLVDIAFRAIQPLYFSTPVQFGGLGLPPSRIGNILSMFGLLNGIIQIFFFAKIHDTWGSKMTYLAGIASSVPVFLTFPILTYLVKSAGEVTTAAWVVVAFQVVISIFISFSYGLSFSRYHPGCMLLTHPIHSQGQFSSTFKPPVPIVLLLVRRMVWAKCLLVSAVLSDLLQRIRCFHFRWSIIIWVDIWSTSCYWAPLH